MQRRANGALTLERDALQGDGELIDLRIPAELLRLAQRTGNVDGASDRRVAGNCLHMKGTQKGRDIEVGQDQVGLGLKVSVQLCLALDLKFRCRLAALRSEKGCAPLRVNDHFRSSRRLPAQDQVAQMNARQNGRSIDRA